MILNLLLTISEVCFNRPYLIVMAQNEGIIRYLCEYYDSHEIVRKEVIQFTLDIIANFFEFCEQLDEPYFKALLLNEISNKLLPAVCNFLSDMSDASDMIESFIYSLSMHMWHVLQ